MAAALTDALGKFELTQRVVEVQQPTQSVVEKTQVSVGTTKSKQDLAEEYLLNHPEAMHMTMRQLEAVTPEEVSISRNTWSKAKRAVKAQK